MCYLRVMKCLVMIRVSTERQKIEDQHAEMEVFCRNEGYDELVFVEDRGASAIKLDDSYRMMIEQVKEEIERDPGIVCFAVWELSRAFRNELVFQEVKQFLVERRIQFIVKNPYLRLLNPDGTVNPGMEVAVTLMATLAKQEMELKKERFKRAKDAMRKQGRYTGGHCIKFGYRVDENGYFVIDEEDSKLVRLIFEMYATGKWSVRKLYDELVERGYRINYHLVNRMVADRSYVDGRYPQMISQELWDRCEQVRKRHFLSIPQGRRHCFGSGILRCPVCGNLMVADADQYRCRKHKRYSAPPNCTNASVVRIENLDGLLWFVASQEEVKYRMVQYRDRKVEIEREVEVLRQKVEAARKKLSFLKEKRSRINELYEEGYITKEEFKKRRNKTLSDAKTYNDTILRLEEKIEGFLTPLRANLEESPSPDVLNGIYSGVLRESEIAEMDRIVKGQIESALAIAAAEFPRSQRSPQKSQDVDEIFSRKSALVIEIVTKYSGVKRFIYVARRFKGHYFFTMDGKPLYTVMQIERESGELVSGAFGKK